MLLKGEGRNQPANKYMKRCSASLNCLGNATYGNNETPLHTSQNSRDWGTHAPWWHGIQFDNFWWINMAYDSATVPAGWPSQRNGKFHPYKSLYTAVGGSFIPNSPKLGTMQTSSVTRQGEHLVAGTYDRKTPSNKKGYLQPLGWISRELCWVGKKPIPKDNMLCDFTYVMFINWQSYRSK